jgi:hypothetical protein
LFIIHSHAGAGLGQPLGYIGQYRHPVLFLSPGASFLEMLFLPFIQREQSLRSPLKVAIIPTFRGIVVQVRILRLKRAKKAFPAEISPWDAIFAIFSYFQYSNPLPTSEAKIFFR